MKRNRPRADKERTPWRGETDKPAWAMGLAEEPGLGQMAREQGREPGHLGSGGRKLPGAEVPLADRLAPDVRERLTRWKKEAEADVANAGADKPVGGRHRTVPTHSAGDPRRLTTDTGRVTTPPETRAGRHAMADNAGDSSQLEPSFAELFDPQDDEGASFAELLDSSRLDWRRFKSD
ncbi:MAG: hypothetical protein IRZ33_00500 [Alicyclobacillaceae bacterium]|nr:hypothetical protein [Alicyclobacillaceae bacterium]